MKRFILLLFVFTFSMDYSPSEAYSSNESSNDKMVYYRDFTPVKLYQYIKEQGIKFPDAVFAQTIVETSHYNTVDNSNAEVFTENLNCFGMRHPRQRETLSLGKKNGHAYFEHWTKSVEDYKLWQDNHNLTGIDNDREYIHFLSKCGYAEADKYEASLLKILKKFVPKYKKDNSYWESRKK